MFVDDKMISCVAENGDQAIHQLNKALKELYPWCLNNRIAPFPRKSESMLLSKTCAVGPIPPVTIGGCFVKLVIKSRLRGVIVDDGLTWITQLSEVKKSFFFLITKIVTYLLPWQTRLNPFFVQCNPAIELLREND